MNSKDSFFEGINKAASNTPKNENVSPILGEAVQRHYQFSDLHNGSWYIEIVAGPNPLLFYCQEIRNGEVVRRSSEPLPYHECRKRFWSRAHKMSIEAGRESPPPETPNIIWTK